VIYQPFELKGVGLIEELSFPIYRRVSTINICAGKFPRLFGRNGDH
jgi:hypothetical protein